MIHHNYFRILSLNFVVHFTSGQLQHAAKNKRWQSINCINYLENKTTYINYPRIEIIDFESINLVHGIFTHSKFLVIIFTKANSIFLYLEFYCLDTHYTTPSSTQCMECTALYYLKITTYSETFMTR